MIDEYKIQPRYEHYSCLIDLLGRSGRLQEAYNVLETNAEIREDVELLSTLLSACCLHKEFELGERIGNVIVEKGSSDPSVYVALSNMYASSRKWKEVGRVRWRMKELGLRKSNPGCSWIEIDDRIAQFFMGDEWHEEADMVRECLAVLYDHMEKVERCGKHDFSILLL
ncbi:unnamed protein product [Linum tenue]|nr:unnamed protein product [Linum tenue]